MTNSRVERASRYGLICLLWVLVGCDSIDATPFASGAEGSLTSAKTQDYYAKDNAPPSRRANPDRTDYFRFEQRGPGVATASFQLSASGQLEVWRANSRFVFTYGYVELDAAITARLFDLAKQVTPDGLLPRKEGVIIEEPSYSLYISSTGTTLGCAEHRAPPALTALGQELQTQRDLATLTTNEHFFVKAEPITAEQLARFSRLDRERRLESLNVIDQRTILRALDWPGTLIVVTPHEFDGLNTHGLGFLVSLGNEDQIIVTLWRRNPRVDKPD